MSTFFAYHKSTRPTGRAIAQELELRMGWNLDRLYRNEEKLIRWGTQLSPHLDSSCQVLNPCESLAKASNKFRSFELLKEAEVPIPRYSRNRTDLTYPMFGRKLRHARGLDIVVLENENDDARGSDFFVEFVPVKREYRFHVFNGELIRTQIKMLSDPERFEANPWVRNHANGFVFGTPAQRPHSSRTNAAKKAVEALGLDFGAVDLIVGNDNKEYVLEVNTAPSSSPMTLSTYVEAFKGWIEGE